MEGWQPIETAPIGDGRDNGPWVLLWEPDEGWRIARYRPRYRGTSLPVWRDDEGLGVRPTHWMPLPDGP